MKRVLLHAAIATLFSMFASAAICWVVLTLMGSAVNWFPIAMSVLCPLLIAFPVSAVTFHQKQRIAGAHEALAAAHQQLAQVHRQLAAAARLDDMTDLLNRGAFIRQVNEAGARGNGGVLLVIDADYFKDINDTFGHLAGDRAICAIAKAIRNCLDRPAAAGRIGGEEFGVFLEAMGLPEGKAVAEKIRQAVERISLCSEQGERIGLSVSIGVARVATDADFSRLMAAADRELYRAKRGGRNRIAAAGSDRPMVVNG